MSGLWRISMSARRSARPRATSSSCRQGPQAADLPVRACRDGEAGPEELVVARPGIGEAPGSILAVTSSTRRSSRRCGGTDRADADPSARRSRGSIRIRPPTAWTPRSTSRRVAASQVGAATVSASVVVGDQPVGRPTSSRRRARLIHRQAACRPDMGLERRQSSMTCSARSAWLSARRAATMRGPSRQLFASTTIP